MMVNNLRLALSCEVSIPPSKNRGSYISHRKAMAIRRAILGLISERPGITTSEIAEDLAMTRPGVHNHVQKLKLAGSIALRTRSRYSGWIVLGAA